MLAHFNQLLGKELVAELVHDAEGDDGSIV